MTLVAIASWVVKPLPEGSQGASIVGGSLYPKSTIRQPLAREVQVQPA